MADPQLWDYVPLSEYNVPSAPVAEVANRGLRRFWSRLRRPNGKATDPDAEIVHQATTEIFDALFASPNWEAVSSVLGGRIITGLADGKRRQVFLGGPHRRTAEMLRSLAGEKGWAVMEAPPPDQILRGRVELPTFLADSVVVIPELAQWYLRHDAGLEVVRTLLDWILSSPFPIIVGCDSWGWSYLDKAIQLAVALPHPRILAPLDATALRGWLRKHATVSGDQPTVFREASTGKVALALNTTPNPDLDPEDAAGEPSNLLTHIAAHGRGLPEITWSLWRESFLRFKADMLTKAAVKAVSRKKERTIWMTSWNQLKLPDFPDKPGHLHLFIKHALLLHAGLHESTLVLILPFPRGEIIRGLHELQVLGIVELASERWRITQAGYPAVRGALADEGYLVDQV